MQHNRRSESIDVQHLEMVDTVLKSRTCSRIDWPNGQMANLISRMLVQAVPSPMIVIA